MKIGQRVFTGNRAVARLNRKMQRGNNNTSNPKHKFKREDEWEITHVYPATQRYRIVRTIDDYIAYVGESEIELITKCCIIDYNTLYINDNGE